eukprot:TRINITY_DN93867_c5_g1_i1.p1 TRINITY_DN93867_c5_g1~~TRINITY_DN93867_c5_g1_i1.p1  ORF type:complete len:674 (+),score=229.60 TRINITY_DN93867_c5_g1_i1:99-2120(+)
MSDPYAQYGQVYDQSSGQYVQNQYGYAQQGVGGQQGYYGAQQGAGAQPGQYYQQQGYYYGGQQQQTQQGQQAQYGAQYSQYYQQPAYGAYSSGQISAAAPTIAAPKKPPTPGEQKSKEFIQKQLKMVPLIHHKQFLMDMGKHTKQLKAKGLFETFDWDSFKLPSYGEKRTITIGSKRQSRFVTMDETSSNTLESPLKTQKKRRLFTDSPMMGASTSSKVSPPSKRGVTSTTDLDQVALELARKMNPNMGKGEYLGAGSGVQTRQQQQQQHQQQQQSTNFFQTVGGLGSQRKSKKDFMLEQMEKAKMKKLQKQQGQIGMQMMHQMMNISRNNKQGKKGKQKKLTKKQQREAAAMMEFTKAGSMNRMKRFAPSSTAVSSLADTTPSWLLRTTEVIIGTCQTLEKSYLRLQEVPPPHTIRPRAILMRALAFVMNKWKNEKLEYLYINDQLKSIRQDLTVQGIKDMFTVKVYETHARVALQNNDQQEFVQCQSQLMILYKLGTLKCRNAPEFVAYRLLHLIWSGEEVQMRTALLDLNDELNKSEPVLHALNVRQAIVDEDFRRFFELYHDTPHLGKCVMDHMVDRMRIVTLQRILSTMKPIVPFPFLQENLGFRASDPKNDEQVKKAKSECLIFCSKNKIPIVKKVDKLFVNTDPALKSFTAVLEERKKARLKTASS